MKINIVKSFSLLLVISLSLRILDVIKNLYISSKFGVSISSDIYISLVYIPESLLILIGFDTIKGVVNSEYSSLNGLNDNKVDLSFKTIFTYLSLTGLILTLVILIFRREIISILLPGFSDEKLILASGIALIIFPLFFLKSFTSLFQSYYNSINRFYFPVITQIVITVSIVVFILLPNKEDDILYRVSLGLLIGNLIYSYILFHPILVRNKGRLINFKMDILSRNIFKNCLSLLAFVSINQVYLFSRNFISSYFPTGNLSAIGYAFTITSSVSTLTFVSSFNVLLSYLAKENFQGFRYKAKGKLITTITYTFLLYIPIVVFFVIFSKEILSFIYLRGNFDKTDIELISSTFIWEALALLPFVIYINFTALYLSLKMYKKLTIVGIIVYGLGILLNFVLSKYIGYYGVSVTSFIIGVLNSFLLIFFSRKIYGKYNLFFLNLLKLIGVLAISFSALYFLKLAGGINFEFGNFINNLLYLSLYFAACIIIWLSASYAFKFNVLTKSKTIFIKSA